MCDAERHPPRQLELEPLLERGADARIRAADVVQAEAAEHVEEAVPVGVVEVGALAARPVPIEADRLQHAHERRVDRAGVQLELAPAVPLDQLTDAERRHARESTAAASG